jgi:hypothetical protein
VEGWKVSGSLFQVSGHRYQQRGVEYQDQGSTWFRIEGGLSEAAVFGEFTAVFRKDGSWAKFLLN